RHAIAHVAGKGGDERFRFEPERQRDVGDATSGEVVDEALDDRQVADWQHGLRRRQRQRPQTSSEPADQDDRAHQPPVVVVEGTGVAVPVAVPATVVSTAAGATPTLVSPVDGSGTVSPGANVVVLAITAPPSAAPSVGNCAAQSGCGMSAPLGTKATVKTMPSLVIRMFFMSVTTSWNVLGSL